MVEDGEDGLGGGGSAIWWHGGRGAKGGRGPLNVGYSGGLNTTTPQPPSRRLPCVYRRGNLDKGGVRHAYLGLDVDGERGRAGAEAEVGGRKRPREVDEVLLIDSHDCGRGDGLVLGRGERRGGSGRIAASLGGGRAWQKRALGEVWFIGSRDGSGHPGKTRHGSFTKAS